MTKDLKGEWLDSQTNDKRHQALEMLLDAWEEALAKGIEADLLASTAIFAALTDMVENHGEDVTARIAEGLPARIRSGEFTLVSEDEDDSK